MPEFPDQGPTARAAGEGAPRGPLAGLTVLDLSRVRSGPAATRLLADWGARVIRIEPPETASGGDGMMGREGSDFANLNRGKASMTLDLKAPEGRDLFRCMVARADVVIENFRPDVKQRLGIAWEDLKPINPALVMASISGFGQDGPYAGRPGFDQIAQGMGGLMSVTGLPGQGPVRAGIPVADLTAGMFCALGILAALLHARATGEGQWLHTSLLEAQVFMMDFQAARTLVEGEVPAQAGNNHPTSIPTGVFPTADRPINLAVAGEVIWQRFCRVAALDHLAADPDFADRDARLANRDRLNALIAERLTSRTAEDWTRMFNEAGVPAGPINDMAQVFADEQVRHLKLAAPVDLPGHAAGTTALLRLPVTLTATPGGIAGPPPALGADTGRVLADLGLTADAIDGLRDRGVI